jgi:hypothetical protein
MHVTYACRFPYWDRHSFCMPYGNLGLNLGNMKFWTRNFEKTFGHKMKFWTALRRPDSIANPYWARCGITWVLGYLWETFGFECGFWKTFTSRITLVILGSNKNLDMVHLTYAYRFPHWEPVHLPFGPLNFYPLKISTALPLRLRFENLLVLGFWILFQKISAIV